MDSLNTYFKKIEEAKSFIEDKLRTQFPTTVIMTGTGLSNISDEIEVSKIISYEEIPHFPRNTVTSHRGSLYIGSYQGNSIAILAGRWHYYEGYSTKEFTLPVRVIKALGCKKIIFTNVAGGVNPDHQPGDIVLITDHINTIPDHPLRGPNDDRLGIRFPDMLNTYDRDLLLSIKNAAKHCNVNIQTGVYYALQGPSLETPAEYTMINKMGADLVGMSTVPEVIVARHAGLNVAAISIVSNVCYPSHRITETTIKQVIEVASEASKKLNQILLHLLSQ